MLPICQGNFLDSKSTQFFQNFYPTTWSWNLINRTSKLTNLSLPPSRTRYSLSYLLYHLREVIITVLDYKLPNFLEPQRQDDTKVVKNDGQSDEFVAGDIWQGNQMSQLDSCVNAMWPSALTSCSIDPVRCEIDHHVTTRAGPTRSQLKFRSVPSWLSSV